ncbi:MAG: acyltransferase domain-containing protein, partial [Acidobacteriota bacterium]
FSALPPEARAAISRELHARIVEKFPEITEDSMPGELANIIAGRVANVFNFHGPNYVCDAACASAMAAIDSAIDGLAEHDFDVVLTGGIDANMSAPTFTKFCKIGALSATGTRPFSEGADGFVMGEGAALLLLKRLEDAERDGDRIYAVIRGMAGSSDGKGKGITAPNPVGQRLAVQRAWDDAGVPPDAGTMIEGHGTSTRVGDVVEVQSLTEVFASARVPLRSIPLGSVKSNIGHLKAAAGAAGVLKAVLSLRDKLLPPSLGFDRPNPNIDFDRSPFFVNTELREWQTRGEVRRAGVSAFGFGGTNFHVVLEEHIPGRLESGRRASVSAAVPADSSIPAQASPAGASAWASDAKLPLRGALVLGTTSREALLSRLREIEREARSGRAPDRCVPAEAALRSPVRMAIDYASPDELAAKIAKALQAFEGGHARAWLALAAQGIFHGAGPAPKVAFLYTGQGSQYANMLAELRRTEPIVAQTIAEADRATLPLLDKPITAFIYADPADKDAMAHAEKRLRQTAITQPAVLTVDLALTRLMAAYGITPDMVMGHSLGEYGALVAAGSLPFDQALEAVSARGRGMANVLVDDQGMMAAVFGPLEKIEAVIAGIDDYVVVANINSHKQAVIGGVHEAVERSISKFRDAGLRVQPLNVSHAFHTKIVAPATEELRRVLTRLDLDSPQIPVVANVTGEFYPMGPGVVPEMIELLSQQVASPVQFIKGLETLYDAGARVFVELGPKNALQGFVKEVLGEREGVVALHTNHPKPGDAASFNHALCGLYAAGLGVGLTEAREQGTVTLAATPPSAAGAPDGTGAAAPARLQPPLPATVAPAPLPAGDAGRVVAADSRLLELGRLFADVLERGMELYAGDRSVAAEPRVVITGAALGLPGTNKILDDENISRILRGDRLIGQIPERFRRAMVDKHVTRLVKNHGGGGRFETIEDPSEAIKLAGLPGEIDLVGEYGVPEERLAALDITTQIAIGAGIDALRDAGIPLTLRYKTTTKRTKLPERWGLPHEVRDETGVIFASAFPGYDAFAKELESFYTDRARRERLEELEALREQVAQGGSGSSELIGELERRIRDLQTEIARQPHRFDRRFLFRVLSMGHAQFAELIGARGPNTQVNAACASGTQAVAMAADWIRTGRCRRVVVVSSDNVTSEHMLEWIGAGFLASGAAATDERLEDAAIPFDRRRHGLLLGMGGSALVLESADSASQRGVQPICEVLSTVVANSA